jgi:type IV fimbrial biogenesis protein FimT
MLGAEEGRLMLSAGPARGFTLIELLITMSVLALLLALGAPAMSTYLQNSKLAAATQQLYSAVQAARTEAIRGNGQAQFVLTDTPVQTPNIANALAPAVAGRNWVVRAADPVLGFRLVEAKAGLEGESSTLAPSVQLLGAAAPAAWNGTITFNALGAPAAAGQTYQIDVSNPAAGLCVAGGGTVRCRRITVSAGGQVVACDPAAPVGDSRAC